MSSESIFGPVTRPVGLETELGVLRPGDAWANPAHVRELAGFGVLVKLALVAVMAIYPPMALPVFWSILLLSTLLSHAPGSLRHRRLL